MSATREKLSRTGDLLLHPGQVLLPEGPRAGMAVLVRAGAFHRVDTVEAVARDHPDLIPVDLPNHLLMPGFIDTHTHLTQSLGKSLVFGEPSEIFRRIWVPLEGSLDERMVYLSAKLAALECLRGGFTTAVDAGTRSEGHIGALVRAAREVGLRSVVGFICNDLGGTAQIPQADVILRQAEEHVSAYRHDPLIRPSLAISIPETASDGMLKAVSDMAAENGVVFQTHVNEHLVAVERSLIARGRRPIEHLAQLGALGPQVLLAHSTLITPHESLSALIQLLHDHEAVTTGTESYADGRIELVGEMPLRELMRGFFDRVKNVSSGYASLSYEFLDERIADVVLLEILVAEEPVPAFARVISRRRVQEEAEKMVEKLHGVLPKQLFVTKIQARSHGRIIASRSLSAMRKDVTGYLYGGDVSRKNKLLDKQKRGKKKLAKHGKVEIPEEVFMKMVQDSDR